MNKIIILLILTLTLSISFENIQANRNQFRNNIFIDKSTQDTGFIPAGYYILDSATLQFNSQDIYKLIVLENDNFRNIENVQHHDLIFDILIKKKGENHFTLWLSNKNLIKNLGKNCPADGYQDVVVKGNFFTIEYVLCDGWNYVNCFLTFRYDSLSNQVILHRFDESFTDRTNPDREIKSRTYSKKDFGVINFTGVSDSLLANLK